MSSAAGTSMFKQPKAVFAVAFACVVSFMGIGLVDPILPALSVQLHATPSQVSLLFTSYLVVTAVAMNSACPRPQPARKPTISPTAPDAPARALNTTTSARPPSSVRFGPRRRRRSSPGWWR